ncbi:MAG TPA: glycine oxidase ThiO [Mycobacteriales bacterium]|nr:glycine oxidase ThiO [Mycobacteriales bacterium]
MARGPDVVIVGGGVIGLATAWRAAGRGLRVSLMDPDPGSGASRVAAGMLAPVTEVHYGEERLLALTLASAARYPDFVADLAEASGRDPGYRACGTLAVALDADDRAALDELAAFQASLGLAIERLTGRECRRLEPMLAPSVRGGVLVEGDHQVDPRRLVPALLTAVERAGVTMSRAAAAEIVVAADRVAGVRLADGTEIAADVVVLAAGCRSAAIAGLPEHVVPPVRPVKGQILRLHGDPRHPFLGRTVRGLVAGSPVYVVPRADGEIVLGATMEEQGYDERVTAGGVYELLRDAHLVLPGISELPLVETAAGLRPGTPDNAPLIGPAQLPGLVLATGHHRNGILLTPVTADAVAELLATGALPDLAAPFAPDRFTRLGAAR